MLPFLQLLFFFQATQQSEIAIPVVVSVLTFAVSTGINYAVSAKAAGRLEGANAKQFEAIDKRLNATERDSENQWKAITSQGKDIAKIEGVLQTKTKGHHA
jgi:hypothetical protein